MNAYRLAVIATVLATGALGSSFASAETVNNGFTFDHSATPTLSAGERTPSQNHTKSRQEVQQELVNARRDGDMQKLDSTVYFGGS
ncbi:DUF4148 domain-containing protein [Paraburkholderia tropica]|uniref:DUF4148 domain-containing protein n=1 Tax=Paraburkholderia tropica TaxID=92647 RepID=UPI00301B4AA8